MLVRVALGARAHADIVVGELTAFAWRVFTIFINNILHAYEVLSRGFLF